MTTRSDHKAHVDRIGGCLNPYDVLVYAGVPFDQWIQEGSGIMDRHATWKLGNVGPLPEGRGLGPGRSRSFAELAAGRPFVRMTYRKMDAWITAEAAERIKAAKVPTRDGTKIRFSPVGLPCEVSVNNQTGLAAVGASRPCGRPIADGDDVCAMHARVATKRAERDAAWAAEREAQRAADRHEEETRRRSEELVAEAAPLLEQLGIRPDTVTVARTGLVQMPSEAFDTILRLAAEMADMQGMGL